MDLKTFWAVLARRKWIVLLTLMAAVGLTVLGTQLATRLYTADTTVRLSTAVSGSLNSVDYELSYADRLMNTYAEIVTSRPLLDEVARLEGLSSEPDVTVRIPDNTELLKITATSEDPETAAAVANRVASELLARSDELSAGNTDATTELLESQLAQAEIQLVEARAAYEALLEQGPADSPEAVEAQGTLELSQASYGALLEQYNDARSRRAIQSVSLTVIEPAIPPEGPSEPRVFLNLALGVIAGVAAAIGLAVTTDGLDSTLNDVDAIESLSDAPIVGLIPHRKVRRRGFRKRVAPPLSAAGEDPDDEALERLRVAMEAATDTSGPGVIMVTSSEDGEGKSTTLVRLAQSYAESGLGVVVVDANTRSPALEELCGSSSVIGLMDSLEHGFDPRMAALRSGIRGVDLIGAGESSAQVAGRLGSPAMELLLKQLREQYDVVLVDTPGLLTVADAAILAPFADGILFLVSLGHTKRGAAVAGLRQLAAVRAKLIGIVVNGADLADFG